MKKAGEEGDWNKKTRDRGGWKRLADEAVKKLQAHLTPDKLKKRKREIFYLNITKHINLHYLHISMHHRCSN